MIVNVVTEAVLKKLKEMGKITSKNRPQTLSFQHAIHAKIINGLCCFFSYYIFETEVYLTGAAHFSSNGPRFGCSVPRCG